MPDRIHVAIVDDHQSIIDGYKFRLSGEPDIKVVATSYYGEEIDPLLAQHQVDVLLLDAHIPTSKYNPAPYPVFIHIPQLIQLDPNLHILIISMHLQRSFIKYAMESGASGYVLKDDYQTIEKLGLVIRLVAGGGVHLSQRALQLLMKDPEAEQKLTNRQLEVLSLCAAYPNDTMAELSLKLNIAHSTFRNLLSGAYLRLGVRNKTAAVTEARRQGLLLTQDQQ